MRAKITIETDLEIFAECGYDMDLEILAETVRHCLRDNMLDKRKIGEIEIKAEYKVEVEGL